VITPEQLIIEMTLGKLFRCSRGVLVNKTLPVVSLSCLGFALMCGLRGWDVSAADWADRQLTDIHNPQAVKLQGGGRGEQKHS